MTSIDDADALPPDLATEVRYGTVDLGYAARLATTPADEDGPVWMVNLMRYRDVADYAPDADGAPPAGETISGREADDRYAPLEAIAAVGGDIVLLADVEAQLLGDGPAWDRIAVVRYPTRRAFIEMQRREDFQRQHVHKEAGMDATIILGGQPLLPPALPDDAPDWADVPHPPNAPGHEEDGYVLVLHVLKYHDDARADHMGEYTSAAGRIAVPHGVRTPAWFTVEGTIVGDGRTWDQARFNAFPSRRAFEAVVFDPERLAHQREHRETAIADTYTMILRPVIDRLAASVDPEGATR